MVGVEAKDNVDVGVLLADFLEGFEHFGRLFSVFSLLRGEMARYQQVLASLGDDRIVVKVEQCLVFLTELIVVFVFRELVLSNDDNRGRFRSFNDIKIASDHFTPAHIHIDLSLL